LAKKAVAFRRISFSIRSSRFSLRRRRNSARSSGLSVSAGPAASERFTQLRTAVSVKSSSLATEATAYYLIAYTATTIAAFGLLTLINAHQVERENVELHHVSGLFWRQPLLAAMMLVALLSLAGIPLTAGFVAKFYIFNAAVSGHNWILLATLILGSGIGIYYYLRVVYFMTRQPEQHHAEPLATGGWRAGALSWVLIASILLLGTVPQSLMAYLRSIL